MNPFHMISFSKYEKALFCSSIKIVSSTFDKSLRKLILQVVPREFEGNEKGTFLTFMSGEKKADQFLRRVSKARFKSLSGFRI